ncbi:hypothetical protein [Neobacillus sp. Marseille-QA0830]
MSIEALSKNTADVFNAIITKPDWDKMVLQERVQKILLQARDSVGSPEAYLESLLDNVTFQYAFTNTALAFLTQCIEEERFFPLETFQSIMANVPKQIQESNFLAENMPRVKELVYKGSSLQEQVAHAERFYFHTKVVNDLLVEFIGTFLHTENKNFMVHFLEYSSKVIVDNVMGCCQTFSNHILKELNSAKSGKAESSSIV